ncbi:hypothetical protein BOSE62_80230 [Bosea sp. 62]|nr:hypothetical protein BOSE7B_140024 [Bosea sp. 7B]CAD5272634.1 hypothetical protein BOSE21B_20150 [Bosea sp. 21B]CAD5274918.1 hypothetical protein BOSE46_20445 [Bosea sp. 46]VVT59234.1 hypothetical protein BOS5A_210025 [Bosea sp. EC-HK365B]VXC24367.1 hypothetical protein BOSE127_170577 [Bosea sp. 127]VXC43913.1 hypothetical protein BOSE29B_30988 [Bosea sp. 29B]VXC67725.1 hypothetical protein BOSE125_30593 [Bosea sp. 125]VXC97748.1 hypothetical protein BOSE62_80230 [Bosea sp. 62]
MRYERQNPAAVCDGVFSIFGCGGAGNHLKLSYFPISYELLKQMALAARSGLFRSAA